MNEEIAAAAQAGSEIVFKANRLKLAMQLAWIVTFMTCFMALLAHHGAGLWDIAPGFFIIVLLACLHFAMWKNEVRLSARGIMLRPFPREYFIEAGDLRRIQLWLRAGFKVVYEEGGRPRRVSMPCDFLSFSDQHRLLGAIEELWPGMLED